MEGPLEERWRVAGSCYRRAVRTLAPTLICLALAGPALPARALASSGPGSEEVEKAQRQIDEGDFELAVRTVEAALDEEDLSDDVLVELYRLLGLAYLYLGDEPKARDAYEKLLQARPDFELPRSAPPKIRELYDRILRDIRHRRVRPVTLELSPISGAQGGREVDVAANIADLPLGARAKLYYRRGGAQAYSSVDFVRQRGATSRYTAVLPGFAVPEEPHPYEVEYYVEVADAARRRLAGRGDAFSPLAFKVAGAAPSTLPARNAWWQNPWVWIAGGAVAAGATAGIVYVATQPRTGDVKITISVSGAL